MNYYNQIKNKLLSNEAYERAKDYSKERYKVKTYYEVGKILYEAGSKYGERIIEKYAIKLEKELGKKYNKRTLFRMKQLYTIFSNEKVSPMGTQMTWSNCRQLLSLKSIDEIKYYINLSIKNSYTKRELEIAIKNKEYDRLDDDTKNKLINKEKTEIKDFIKNPIMIKNNSNKEIINEKLLKQLILENIVYFMKELGSDLSFVDSEYKIKIGEKYNYIDLLLYSIEYSCYVVVELKITELKKEHIGQILTYKNYIDKNLKKINQEDTIGIIISKKNNKYIMSYCTDDKIISREYKLFN